MGDFPCTAKGAHGAFQADCDSAYAGVGTQFKCGALGGGTGTGGDLGLPSEIDFVDNAIAMYHDGARDFVFSQRLRRAQVEELWRSDVKMMYAMYPKSEITYTLPTSFLLLDGSYAKRLETGRRPAIMYQGRITLKPIKKTKPGENAPGDGQHNSLEK